VELHEDRGVGPYIQSYQSGEITIDNTHYQHSVIVMPEQAVQEWRPQNFTDLTAEDFAVLVTFKPDLILLGTGEEQHFPKSELMAIAYQHNIAVEVMNTGSACRTYNLLMSEHRVVLAALVLQ
jgi:uncharacterized protein